MPYLLLLQLPSNMAIGPIISFGTSSGNSITGGAIQYAGYASLNQERALNMGSGTNNTVTNVIFEYNAGTLNQTYCNIGYVQVP